MAALASPDKKTFVAGLANNRAGRILSNHLSAVALRATSGGHDSAVSEAIANERVFVHALNAAVRGRRPFPCGLSMPLPRYIAIVNLSGERMLVHSQSAALLTTLCTRSATVHAQELGGFLAAFEQIPIHRTPDCCKFVLLTYSLPWQSGVQAAFWHLSACCIEHGGEPGHEHVRFADRVLCFSGASERPFAGKPVLDPRDRQIALADDAEPLELVARKQMDDFEEAYSPACLDGPSVLLQVPAEGGKNAQLLGLVQELTRQRTEDQAEAKRLRAEVADRESAVGALVSQNEELAKCMEGAHALEMEKLRTETDAQLLLSRQQQSALNAEMIVERVASSKAAEEKARERKAHERVVARCDELRRQSEGKDKLHNAALGKHRAEIVRLEARLEAATAQAGTLKARLDKEHAALVLRQQTLHTTSLERVHAALASKEQLLNQLSDNNERLSVEALSLKSHDEEQAAAIARLEQELAVVCAPTAREVGTSTCNASTATHHCASTQTAPLPADGNASGGGGGGGGNGNGNGNGNGGGGGTTTGHKGVPRAHPNYQAAIDALQELVHHSRGVRPALPVAYGNGYAVPLPLPFPHYTPNGHPRPYPPPAHRAPQ